jgi:dUTP pyrophosphatase
LPRSGTGTKGLVLANTIGLIDSDYQGEIKVTIINRNIDGYIVIEPYMRIAQLVFIPVIHPEIKEVIEFSDKTGRSNNGFGSTGF